MSKLTDVIDRYIATWNETDAERRRALIVRTWTETASYLDPVLQGESQAGIDAMIQGVQARFPGHQFRRTSLVSMLATGLGDFCHVLAATAGLSALLLSSSLASSVVKYASAAYLLYLRVRTLLSRDDGHSYPLP
jgi:hypothetical protein